MKTLRAPDISKPKFLSEVTIKIRPQINVVSLSGKGDPMKTFDNKTNKLIDWLEERDVKPTGPTLGIYYLDRRKVGVKNVKWDACVPIRNQVRAEGKVKLQVLPKVRVINVILTGDYALIGPALEYLETVAGDFGIEIGWPLTEIYHKEGRDPVTELQYFAK